MGELIVWLAFIVAAFVPTRVEASARSRAVVRPSPPTMNRGEQFLFGGGPSEIVPGLARPKKRGP
jgi:hypothetical protein